MRRISLPPMTDSELNMLNGFIGQMSDGAGENLSWTTKYWTNMGWFEKNGSNTYIDVDDTVKPFMGKSDDEIIEDLCERFIDIATDVYNTCGMSTVYHDDTDLDEPQAIDDANSIVEKLSGEKDHWEALDRDEYLAECAENEIKMNRLNDLLCQGIDELNAACDLLGTDREGEIDLLHKKAAGRDAEIEQLLRELEGR